MSKKIYIKRKKLLKLVDKFIYEQAIYPDFMLYLQSRGFAVDEKRKLHKQITFKKGGL